MTRVDHAADLRARLAHAHRLEVAGQVLQAELIYNGVLKQGPGNIEAVTGLARLALRSGDSSQAVQLLQAAARMYPLNSQLGVDLAVALANAGQLPAAIKSIESTLAITSSHHVAWLLLGQLREAMGNSSGALNAFYQAVTRAQRAGQWKDVESTPPEILAAVVAAIEWVRNGRRELFLGAYDELRQQHGPTALARVDRAVTGYLNDWDSRPTDPRQRPKFFFFPDLPNTPYQDPYLHSWASRLASAYPLIRADALRVLEADRCLPNFIPDSARVEDYVSGEGAAPSWEAFFFYRRGKRFDVNHRRCPDTSAVLESIELCRIADQAPEILFSVLKPGSHINAHHGVTNVRLVMHLPLVVPRDCALNLVEHGEHRWEEGRLVMFDDTYLHEAWNRSEATRIVLLMDCWNPHLTAVERHAVQQLLQTISGLHLADRAPKRATT